MRTLFSESSDITPRKLDGLTIIDFTAAVAGPLATQLLADSGARVIKIEPPNGDFLRKTWPIGDTEPSYYFVSVNRGKESVCLDLKNAEDLDFAKKLIRHADVLVENFRPGVMNRLGLGYDAVKQLNPEIIYASLSGFGQTGPNHDHACFDLVAQAYSGLMQTNGNNNTGPNRVGFSIADVATAMWGYMAITTALFARERYGEGDHIDVAMVDSLFAMQIAPVAAYTSLNKEPENDGNRSGAAAPFGTLPTRDGHIVVAVVSEKQWQIFCKTIDAPELAQNELFASPSLRLKNRDYMREILHPLFIQRTSAEWLDILQVGGIPSGPINTMEQICHSAQIKERNMLVTVGNIKVAGNPMKFLKQSYASHYAPVPEAGEHTAAVKQEFCQKESK
ncbi:TPA: CoA transferase [Citrobacter braakii]|uniref:CaiB/BaiF CoA transferase family protein n=1 Tax=Citrobacter sp. Cb031 TaxID=2985025 RepID=UPI00257C8B78|nr:CoA transferase [Citrobacter sp. Cb031]MDM3464676.1 CoA transferase [Citrobacter sp. Cb031]